MLTVLLPPISDAGPNGYTGAPAGQHYLQVDEDPQDGDASFLNVLLNGSEAYGIDVSAIPPGALIVAVRVRFAVKGVPSDQTQSRAGLRVAGVDYLGPVHTVGAGTGYLLFTDSDMQTSPASGLAWTKNELAATALRHVPVSQPSDLPRPRLSQLVAFADIIPAVARPHGSGASLAPHGAGSGRAPVARGSSLSPRGSVRSLAPGGAGASRAPHATGAARGVSVSGQSLADRAASIVSRSGLRVAAVSLSPRAGGASLKPTVVGAALVDSGGGE